MKKERSGEQRMRAKEKQTSGETVKHFQEMENRKGSKTPEESALFDTSKIKISLKFESVILNFFSVLSNSVDNLDKDQLSKSMLKTQVPI